ncbi:hypothetical protein E3C22_00505 [Jiella endophytica]|uniref:Lipoprotein n=1 Tax=Jiella endophytica TaxID=2558362 RepID=A0A4Y8RER3_9HYPH|nr:hypothetical protein [Jiella endophytica]TFF20701.1 hypothetical protein E3C22_17545 [Jiella endophytica]TFF27002.1 hypothetical protein E3C22_00505 [Jiella endophytica]
MQTRAPLATTALLSVLLALGACSTGPSVGPQSSDTGLDRMERLALNANRCWFKSKDPAFAAYSLAPELSSFSGRPRFLLVPKGKPEARPLVVVEGESGSARISTYGPLMSDSLGGRIGADVNRWAAGNNGCSA